MARAFASLVAACVAATLVGTSGTAYAAAPPTTVPSHEAVPASGQVTVRWTNPADPDFAGVTVVWKAETPPASVADGTARAVDSGTSTVVTGLTNGTTYGFSIFTRNTDGDVSAPASFTATPIPPIATTITAKSTPSTVYFDKPTVLTATLRRADSNVLVSGVTVDFWRRTYGNTTFGRVARVTTNASGVATYKTPNLGKNVRWYATFTGNPYYGTSKTAGFTTYVKPVVTYTASPRLAEQNVRSTVNALVTPSHAGRTAYLQHKSGTTWKTVAAKALSSTSRVSFTTSNATIGTRYYRLLVPAHDDHAEARSTTFGIVTVQRTIRQGMSGSDVLAVQKRLAALRYDVGSVNGYFGYDSVHATMAFQKVNRLRVTGAVDSTTRARLNSPIRPTLRYSHSGAWVEADLRKQTLYYARDGVIVRILDISSGNNQLYTVEGDTQRATTPTGNFRIFHKINGLRVSRLGSLWKPAYFASGGYAIHGSGFVPAYPDSHGCIRITNPAMDRLFSMLTIGMPVHVYYS